MVNIPGVSVQIQIYESANSLVYRATRTADNYPVILKVLKENYPTPQQLARYRTEYEITNSLNLTGVVKAYDLQKYQNTLVMSLEDFGGESLRVWMQQRSFTLEEILKIAIATTETLGQIHSVNIIHKDINSSNIVYNPASEEIKIIDFGISTKLNRENPTLKNPNVIEGTLAYMSPEQTGRMNRLLDYRTDFYSLGITFYELLTNQLPFDTTDALELVHCHIAKQPLPPSTINSQIPQVVSDIVLKLMAKTAEERYQSAYGIKSDLEECLHQLQQSKEILYFTIADQDISNKFQLPQKLYGREREIDTLLTAFERVTYQSEMILIAGYSGIGKTALVQEIYKPITQKRGYFISGKFDQYQRNIPYSAVVHAFQSLVKQLLTESEAQLKEWRAKLLATLGVNGQVIVDVIPEVELIIGKQPSIQELGATESQNRFNLVFQNFIKVFTKPEHPLVIFLDDLQWADGASLKLMQLLISSSSPGLFLIGAYRDNEVSVAHPLMLTLDEITKSGAIINRIFLSPLDLLTVTQIISDTLKSEPEMVKPLAELVLIKTGGNPFFMNEFLRSLYTEKLWEFNWQTRQWQWDLQKIKRREFTDNVVELMTSKIQRLPENTQEILKLAACMGNQFQLKNLALVSEKALRETIKELEPAVAETLVVNLGDMGDVELVIAATEFDFSQLPIKQQPLAEYKFVHDRIQQAAYSLIPEQARSLAHYQIGQLLLWQNTPEAIEEQIFVVVNQLNYGIGLMADQTERDRLAQLNLSAGRKARAANAYQAAGEYSAIGLNLLGREAWQQHYETTLKLHELAAEVASLCGEFDRMEQWVAAAIQHSKTPLERVKVYILKIQALASQNKLLEAISVGLSILEEFGIQFPSHPTPELFRQVVQEINSSIGPRSIEELFHLPKMVDPEKLATMRIAASIVAACYIVGSPLLPLVIAFQVNSSLQYGNSPISAYSYAAYGVCLNNFLQEVTEATEFGQLAQRLAWAEEDKNIRAETFSVIPLFLTHRKYHLRDSLSISRAGYQAGLEVGNLETIGYNTHQFCVNSFWCGQPLAELEPQISAYRQQLLDLNQITTANYCLIYWEITLFLLGNPQQIEICFAQAGYEEKLLSQSLASNDLLRIFFFYVHRAILRFLFGEIGLAKADTVQARQYMAGGAGTICEAGLYFYDSLIAIASLPESQPDLEAQWQRIEENQAKLLHWAEHAPMNYLHKWQLVEAEKYRVSKQKAEAISFYDQAIAGARENHYLHEEALANELAAKFYLAWGKVKVAQAYLQEAYYCYASWGAKAKTDDLEKCYPQLLISNQSSIIDSTNVTISDSGYNLDIATVMKASQTISGEIMLDKLLSSLMEILIENVGAETGYLILPSQGKLLIEASVKISEPVKVLQSIQIGNSSSVCQGIINYVFRTKEIVVLNDASNEGKFTSDLYIKQNKPKSILCVPLLNQSQVISVVYLENNLTTGAFTRKRIEILKLLSGQAAISIQNAKLYTEVRENENRLTQFLEAMPVGVYIVDAQGKSYYLNNVAQKLLGKGLVSTGAIEEISEVYQIYQTGTNQQYPAANLPISRALHGESATEDDMEIHQGDRVIPIETRGTPVYDEKGNIIYAIVAFQDITERKKSEIERQRFTNELFQLNKAYERFVPRQFLQFLEKASIIDVELGDQVQLEMSVLFSDIRDFTTLSEKMTPDDNFKFINSYLSRMEPAITENHGFIDKYIGDAIMALFSGEADNAVKAGISMLHRLAEYNQYRAKEHYPLIKIGIGINTGSLMLGTVGGQNHMDSTVISDAVNLASRVENLTKNYGVALLITQQTYSRLANPTNYAIRNIDTVKVKGKSQAITVYEVFDADLPEIKEGKLATIETFTEALSLYNEGNLVKANTLFEECLRVNPGDKVAKIYFERSQNNRLN